MDDPSTTGVTEGFGLMFYNARMYDPYLNQFTQPDTIVPDPYNTQDWNRYAYARNNPVKYTDPTGHCPAEADDWCFMDDEVEALQEEFDNFDGPDTYREDEMLEISFINLGSYSVIRDLTPEEFQLFLRADGTRNGQKLFEFGLASQAAIDIAESQFPGMPDGDNPRNAFQHAFWSALLVDEFGLEFASSLGYAHERSDTSTPETQFMDLHNNEIGRNIAEANPNAGSRQIQEMIMSAIRNGDMVVLNNSYLPVPSNYFSFDYFNQ